ncbi:MULTISPECIES: YhfC family intramembrane metalloprotease [unclassified Paenibacillus]|uniref:YhfC family intramembrane metalloprotease n=1 Tax=unclassified Paenibacillus TaxID=185978 RepID=UPI001AE84A00|nr:MULTISPECIES: YhfC family intramembrane metalloprotease [unclassified Paenibacillus]MBP1154304.1 putative membrane protein YhfC [Paenibacillus sp. PvP091]MBP1170312.1 putative membrane protein YhfC [Paenibacillus sp. PvR098]MBP2441340.1 putative membrane protein YhfC [Paenibacillus sp. PvP052]
MIQQITITGMFIQLLISVLIPIALIIFVKKKNSFRWKSFFVGAAVFIIFVQILEKIPHLIMIDSTGTSLKWTANPYLFALYGGLAAGIFEELGRYLGYRWLLRKHELQRKDGLSYGLGHGGIEAVLIGGGLAISSMVMAFAINAGTFEQLVGHKAPAEQVAQFKEQLMNRDFWYYVLGGVERSFALFIQIGLSLLVLLGVIHNQFKYVVLSIAVHALINFFAALFQAGVIHNVWLVEAIFFIAAVIAIGFIKKSKKLLH